MSVQEHSGQEQVVYRFAGCELDPREHRLLVHGQPVTLTPKVFETLVLLVERAGHVVSKDELMAALWPRGFVHESNLTKHIWVIRRALGDGEDEGRCIETVPKLGYRFVAPVQKLVQEQAANGGQPPATTDSHATASLPLRGTDAGGENGAHWTAGRDADRRQDASGVESTANVGATEPVAALPAIRNTDRLRLMAFALAAIVLAGGWYMWHATRKGAAGTTSVPDANAVAIVDFNNLSGNAKDAWLGPALTEMLATEIAVDGRLHAVPDELVRPARADLPEPAAGGYAPASLTTLQRRLGAHYVLSGAYLVLGPADTPRLRIDLAVQDTGNGAAIATLSRSGTVADLPALIAQTGAALRGSLGSTPAAPEQLREIANAQPPSTEVARRMGFALDALHKYDPARARDELLLAIAQAPGYAPAYMYLARAWSELGYRAKALAASKQASANAQGLPPEQQLLIQAQQAVLQADHGRAIGSYQKLVALRPRDPGYRLQLTDAQLDAGKPGAAETVLDELRKLSIDSGDPRIEFAAARIAVAKGDSPGYVRHARLALQQAQARGEAGLIANAELQLGIALDQDAQADPLLRKAAADFRRIGNPHGEALAWQNVGNLQNSRNQIAAARESYQRAMTIYQGIGDLGGEAAIYDDLTRMLWAGGDRDGAEAALRQALRIGRETNDLVRQAWTLTGLATVLSDESNSDAVATMYQQAIALDRQAGDQGHLVYAISTYADLLRGRGELDRAHDMCAQAMSAERALPGSANSAGVEVICAQVALDRGDVDAAVASLTGVAQKAAVAKDTFDAANAQLLLGQIALGRQQWSAARGVLQQSLQGWVASQEPSGQSVCEGLLALTYAALGDSVARDRAAARARELRSRVNQRFEVLPVDIALAELQGDSGDRDAAITALNELADDAMKRQWMGMALEARLAAVHLLERGSDRTAAKAARDALTTDARKAGFGWVDQRLAMTQAAPGRR